MTYSNDNIIYITQVFGGSAFVFFAFLSNSIYDDTRLLCAFMGILIIGCSTIVHFNKG
jgi:hypothetical protein